MSSSKSARLTQRLFFLPWLFSGLFLAFVSNLPAQNVDQIIGETAYYEVHSNYWLNLHHFIYQSAKKSQKDLVENQDSAIFSRLLAHERAPLDAAIEYYRNNLIEQSLLFNLGSLKIWLLGQTDFVLQADTVDRNDLMEILQAASITYKANFWSRHHRQNVDVWEQDKALIMDMEQGTVGRISKFAQKEWPAERVRIDLTPYANWAGAYTSSRPFPHVVISTYDQQVLSSQWIEIVFHESSHILFSWDGPIQATIRMQQKERAVLLPRGMWHAILFYVCGRVVQKELKEREIDHQLYMRKHSVFKGFQTPGFEATLDAYMAEEIDLTLAVKMLVDEFQKTKD